MPSSVSRRGLIVVAAALSVTALSAREFRAMWRVDEIRPGPGVTLVGRLSDTLPALAGTFLLVRLGYRALGLRETRTAERLLEVVASDRAPP